MTLALPVRTRPGLRALPGWAAAVLLLLGTVVVGPVLGGLSRPLFIVGCLAVGWYAWRRDAGDHLQTVLVLFCFAPFARRIVDLAVGFDSAGIMLIGPLLAVLASAGQLTRLLDRDGPMPPAIAPIVGVGLCVAYATALSMVQADWMNAASGALKWVAPLVYAAALVLQPERPEKLLAAAARAFVVILPVMGLYGIYQYVDPPAWDRYWMQSATILSVGYPLPYQVRVFSTMNAPASFATFTAAGLMLICYLRADRLSLLLALPSVLALLLSSYRTAWISLAAGVVFCGFFDATRRRSLLVIGGLVLAVALVATLTPFGDAIGDRLASFNAGAQDGSAQERLQEFVLLWMQPDSGLFGRGFTITDVGSAGALAIDGTIVACWVSMGIVVGLVCLAAMVWAAGLPIAAALRSRSREAIVAGALAIGALCQMPLASIASGELGVLFWTFAVLAPRETDRGPVRGRHALA